MKMLSTIIVSLIVVTSVYSQESVIRDYALSFGIGNNFTLTNFDMDIAVKEILKDGNQIRLFLSPRVNIGNQESNTSGTSITTEYDNNSYLLGLGADYLLKLISKDEFEMYGGGGLYGAFGNDGFTKTNTKYPNGTYTLKETTSPTWSAGLRGVLGVEWRANDRIGIHCEYLAIASYTWNKIETVQSGTSIVPVVTTKQTFNSFNLNSRVMFGLSVYL